MKAFVKTPGKAPELRSVPEPKITAGNILLRVLSVGLCRTDLAVASEEIWRDKPLILGHEFSAEVVQLHNEYSGNIKVGDIVTVDPLYGKEFMGLHFDGAICELIAVPEKQVYKIATRVGTGEYSAYSRPLSVKDIPANVIAYAEPVAASMAVLRANLHGKGAIYGENRIALLTQMILQSYGYNIPIINEKLPISENSYDFIIETVTNETSIAKLCWGLKPEGLLIMKSRKHEAPLPVGVVVLKDIQIQGVSYGDWKLVGPWLMQNQCSIEEELLGETFELDNVTEAFIHAGTGESNKTFVKVGKL